MEKEPSAHDRRIDRRGSGREGGMNRPLRVGLTGGIGSGKSTVREYFGELGVPTVDADEISHRITRPGEAAFHDIVALFGEESLDDSGGLRRPYLRERVFGDPSLRRKLEAIIHPRVHDEIRAFIDEVNYPYCIICIPLLLETGAEAGMDRVLVVDAPEELQVLRTSRRDRTSEHQARRIIDAQAGREQRLGAATDIIVNDSDLENLKTRVRQLHDAYLDLTGRVVNRQT